MVVEALGAAVVVSGWGINLILLAEQKLELLIKNLYGLNIKENKDLQNVQQSLVKLKIFLTKVKGILRLAVVDEVNDPGILFWLKHIQHSAYQAEDFFDRFQVEYVEGSGRYSETYMEETRKELTKLLDNASTLINEYDGLRDSGLWRRSDSDVSNRIYESTSNSLGKVIFGRENDKSELLDKIEGVASERTGGIPVVSIVGIPGVGKTTVAQLLFHDPRIVKKYVRIWLSMHHDFHLDVILKAIIEGLTGKKCEVLNSHYLHIEFELRIRGRCIFLVLDNARHELREEWSELLGSLKCAGEGSVVLVTTQSPVVSSVTGSRLVYDLPKLSEEDCWSIFQQNVFPSHEYGANRPKLCGVGREIVKRCYGLPLIATTLGHLLFSKDNIKEWEFILSAKLWDLPVDNAIAHSLRLCYHQLPEYLKVLVPYFGFLSRDFQLEKETLVQLWMAEELIQPKGVMQLDDLGHIYFDEMVKRGFFLSLDEDGLKFEVHGFVHDMVQLVNVDGSFRSIISEKSDLLENTDFVRHISINMAGLEIEHLFKFKRLRTILLLSASGPLRNFFGSFSVGGLTHIRVLDLSHSSITEVTPTAISLIPQLRYLDVSHTPIVTISRAVYGLRRLQTIKVRGCLNLGELPNGIGQCVSLQHIDLDEICEIATPADIGKLTQLQSLGRFAVSPEGCDVSQLKNLNMLKNSLCLSGLEHVGFMDRTFGCVKEKENLKRLKLEWSPNAKNVFQWISRFLQPHSNLRELVIQRYPLEKWGWSWTWSSSSSLERIELVDCDKLESIVILRNLPLLKTLSLQGNKSVEIFVIQDFFGFGGPHPGFESLEELSLVSWTRCTTWTDLEERRMPKLGKLFIRDCSVLTILPDFSCLPLLNKLEIVDCGSLKYSVGRTRPPQLHTLSTNECHHLAPCSPSVEGWPFSCPPEEQSMSSRS